MVISLVNIRFTQDVSVDQQGDVEGDIELRLKYAYVNVKTGNWGIFTDTNIEFGVVHRPWTDYEQKINDYRAQGSMFLDANGFVSSADYGATFFSLFGGEMNDQYQEKVNSNYPGRYGSLSIGIYNGGGYNALEKNNNKLAEGRLSLRPMPDNLPGFQTSFFGSYGKGNIPQNPEFWQYASAVSLESEKWVGLVQGFIGRGDSQGQFVNSAFQAIDLQGWSAFLELKPFATPISLTLRADEIYHRNREDWMMRNGIAGLAYVFNNRSKIIVDVHRTLENQFPGEISYTRLEILTEIRF